MELCKCIDVIMKYCDEMMRRYGQHHNDYLYYDLYCFLSRLKDFVCEVKGNAPL